MVAGAGFEPTTFGLWARRATRLLHPALFIFFSKLYFFWCRGPESNRYDVWPSQDFKSCASACSATPAYICKSLVFGFYFLLISKLWFYCLSSNFISPRASPSGCLSWQYFLIAIFSLCSASLQIIDLKRCELWPSYPSLNFISLRVGQVYFGYADHFMEPQYDGDDFLLWPDGPALALRVGLEPTTYRLTAGCSTIELPKHILFHLLLD